MLLRRLAIACLCLVLHQLLPEVVPSVLAAAYSLTTYNKNWLCMCHGPKLLADLERCNFNYSWFLCSVFYEVHNVRTHPCLKYGRIPDFEQGWVRPCFVRGATRSHTALFAVPPDSRKRVGATLSFKITRANTVGTHSWPKYRQIQDSEQGWCDPEFLRGAQGRAHRAHPC